MDSWFDYAQFRLKEAASLPAGWDNDSAEAVDDQSLEMAQVLVVLLDELEAPRPFITPSPSGGICFEWVAPSVELTIEILGEEMTAHIARPAPAEDVEGDLGALWDLTKRAIEELAS